jgi:hypothetical protein
VLAAVGALSALAPPAGADTDCRLAFERWAKQSATYLRVVPHSQSQGRGACVPNEAVRRQLLEELGRTRTVCSVAATDENLAQARTVLNINQGFISSLAVCDSDAADAGAGWATKSAPTAQPPEPPPRPVAVTPPASPKPVAAVPPPPRPVAVPPPPAPKPAVAAPPPTPPCLEIAPASEKEYALVNRRCRGHTVIAVIETRGGEGETVCRGYTITQSLSVRAPKNAPPRVNHECVTTNGSCNKDRLGNMFPECDW